ncbi:3-hydroxyacyl-ACP dehydratase FabZ family protein [Candidatus Electronema sp. PJ]|uniref:3-hydroxyacyl-ACP dehydratase FabZ family protein n=1 Tax=Candidatus Electronema sp. PJ TaxID=3401572 RepID=UPI003AA870EE
MDRDFIMARIPHRPPFLWLDRVLELTESAIRAEITISAELDIFKGHYPDYPIMPGVLLCEAVFQAGALLIAETLRGKQDLQGIPVLTRILGAKFKREVRPGDLIEITAALKEQIGPAWFLKGGVQVGGKTAVQVEFACALKGRGA